MRGYWTLSSPPFVLENRHTMWQPALINITIPVFNRPERTLATIEGIRKTDTSIPYVVTVVDNGSGRETVDVLLRLKAEGLIDTLLLVESNLGVSLAANLGWQAVESELYLKLDNDMQLLDPDWLAGLFARWNAVGTHSAIAPAWREELYRQGTLIQTPAGELRRCPDSIAGSAMFVPSSVSDILGYWTEDYGLYGAEDGDYGVRMRLAGFPQYYYLPEGIFRNLGETPAEDTYEKAGIDKSEIMGGLYAGKDGAPGPFVLNALLYSLKVRSLRVPLKYELVDVKEDCRVVLRVSRRYREVRKGLHICSELLRKLCPGGGQAISVSPQVVKRMRGIMEDHGDNPLVPF